jgi:hypothetical protein
MNIYGLFLNKNKYKVIIVYNVRFLKSQRYKFQQLTKLYKYSPNPHLFYIAK